MKKQPEITVSEHHGKGGSYVINEAGELVLAERTKQVGEAVETTAEKTEVDAGALKADVKPVAKAKQ